MKKLFAFVLVAACLSFGQTKIDLGKQKGIVPIVNGGTGSPGTLTVSTSPGDIPFGTVQIGTSSISQNVAISNTGTQPLTVGTVAISGPGAAHFSTTQICAGEVIDGGAACIEQVSYKPISAIAETATLTVTTNAPIDPVNPLTVALSGTGSSGVTYTLTIAGAAVRTGSGVVTSADGLINCVLLTGSAGTGKCAAGYASGAQPVLTGTPNAPDSFGVFSGGGCTTSPCTLGALAAATTVTASFTAPVATALLSIVGGGTGTGRSDSDLNDVITGNKIGCTSTAGVLTTGQKCSGTFNVGDVVTLTETPSLTGVGTCTGAACTFTSWAGATGCTNGTTCAITTSGPQTVAMNFAAPTGAASIALVQPIDGGAMGTNNVTGNFSLAQSAGNTNIIYVEWDNATTTVSSVTDTKGNTYTQAPTCSPKVGTGLSLALYYAKNIVAAAAGANTVTVALSATPAYRAILGAEYSGLDTTAPLDACAGNTGNSTSPSSGSFVSTGANELVTGGDIVASHITANSPSFTQEILFSGNDMEDRQNVPAASYTFAPTQATAIPWAAIGAAWKNGGGGGGVVSNYSVTVICGGTGSGTVSASGSTLTCTNGVPTGGISLSVAPNATLNLVATPLSGSTFANYLGAGCGTNPSCTTTPINSTMTIKATFNPPVTTNCTPGTWSITNQPPISCRPYPNSLFNKPLPNAGAGGPITHLATNSDVIAQATVISSAIWAVASTGNDGTLMVPIYYGRATDPIYKLNSCPSAGGSDLAHNPLNTFWHVPNQAQMSGGQSDQFITVWDQTNNQVLSAYKGSSGLGTTAPPNKLASCSATTTATACPMTGTMAISFCNMANYLTDKGYQAGNGAGDTLADAPRALVLGVNEWMAGTINHALYLNSVNTATSASVFPAGSSTGRQAAGNWPPMGSLYFFDYTDAQINAMGLPAWQKAIVLAMSHYGAYVGDTGATAGVNLSRTEAGEAYFTAGITYPIPAWLISQGLSPHADGTSAQVFNLNLWSGIPLVGGLTVGQHAHIAAPCVALALAGQPGGCP